MILLKKKLFSLQRDIAKGMILHMILVTITGSNLRVMKDRMFSEPDIIEHSNLQKDAITSKDISKESGVDSTKMDSAREEPMQLKHTTALSKVLSSEEPAVVKVTTKLPKTSARVLTSSENMKILEEKEKKKQEEADEKKKRKIAAEEKRKEKEKLKRSKGKKGYI